MSRTRAPPVAIDPRRSLTQEGSRVARAHLRAAIRLGASVRRLRRPESVHQLRVALRRHHEAVQVFRRFLPSAAPEAARRLDRLNERLAPLRDLDVVIDLLRDPDLEEIFPDPDFLPILRRRLAQWRSAESKRVREFLGTPEARRNLSGHAWPALAAVAAPARAVAWASFALRELDRRVREIRNAEKALDLERPETFHGLRKHLRRLRYFLEALGPLAGDSAPRVLSRLVKAQDLLGRHQDCWVVARHLEQLGGDRAVDLPGTAGFMAGLLVAHEQNEARRMRARFLERRSVLGRKRFRRVRRELERLAALEPARSRRVRRRRSGP